MMMMMMTLSLDKLLTSANLVALGQILWANYRSQENCE